MVGISFWFSFKVLLPFGCRQGSVTIRRGAWKGKVKDIIEPPRRPTKEGVEDKKAKKKQLRHNKKHTGVHRTQSLFAPEGQVVQQDGLLTDFLDSDPYETLFGVTRYCKCNWGHLSSEPGLR